MSFLAQFYFQDRTFHGGDLPGDLLLVFAKDDTFSEFDSVFVEWQSLSVDPLVTAEQMPATDWEVIKCYGYRDRTWDFDDGSTWDYSHGSDSRESPFVLRGTKIGGVPSCSDLAFGPEDGDLGSFLCQLAEVSPAVAVPYPWINVNKSIEEDNERYDALELVDAGVLCFFITDSGSVNWRFQCS